jgi:hypothetical protein
MKTDITTPEPQVSTLSGELSLLEPDPSTMRMTDIITALRHQARFGGHTTERVTILQHSLCVWLLSWMDGVSFDDQLHALWHDAPEAYILDIPRPLKRLLGRAYSDVEDVFTAAVGDAISVPLSHGEPLDLRKWDTEALAAECVLWRPSEAYADWQGLPVVTQDIRGAARAARVMAALPNSQIVWLDHLLREGRTGSVRAWISTVYPLDCLGYGSRNPGKSEVTR